MYKNKIKWLPSEIGILINLQTLCLSKNQITSLPHSVLEIGQLINLKRLDLSSNQISSIPWELQNMVDNGLIKIENNLN